MLSFEFCSKPKMPKCFICCTSLVPTAKIVPARKVATMISPRKVIYFTYVWLLVFVTSNSVRKVPNDEATISVPIVFLLSKQMISSPSSRVDGTHNHRLTRSTSPLPPSSTHTCSQPSIKLILHVSVTFVVFHVKWEQAQPSAPPTKVGSFCTVLGLAWRFNIGKVPLTFGQYSGKLFGRQQSCACVNRVRWSQSSAANLLPLKSTSITPGNPRSGRGWWIEVGYHSGREPRSCPSKGDSISPVGRKANAVGD